MQLQDNYAMMEEQIDPRPMTIDISQQSKKKKGSPIKQKKQIVPQ